MFGIVPRPEGKQSNPLIRNGYFPVWFFILSSYFRNPFVIVYGIAAMAPTSHARCNQTDPKSDLCLRNVGGKNKNFAMESVEDLVLVSANRRIVCMQIISLVVHCSLLNFIKLFSYWLLFFSWNFYYTQFLWIWVTINNQKCGKHFINKSNIKNVNYIYKYLYMYICFIRFFIELKIRQKQGKNAPIQLIYRKLRSL